MSLLVVVWSVAYVLLGLLLLIRNNAVYWFRIGLLDRMRYRCLDYESRVQAMEAYDRLPSYVAMLLKFWVWPLTKFLPEDYRW